MNETCQPLLSAARRMTRGEDHDEEDHLPRALQTTPTPAATPNNTNCINQTCTFQQQLNALSFAGGTICNFNPINTQSTMGNFADCDPSDEIAAGIAEGTAISSSLDEEEDQEEVAVRGIEAIQASVLAQELCQCEEEEVYEEVVTAGVPANGATRARRTQKVR